MLRESGASSTPRLQLR